MDTVKETKPASSDVEKNKTMAILAYFIFFLPLLTAKDSKFARFHANQSLILVIISVAANILAGVIPVVGGIIAAVAGIGVLVLWIMGIISAANGETKPLPVIGTYKLLK
jgi:uncharacterized membrane protein